MDEGPWHAVASAAWVARVVACYTDFESLVEPTYRQPLVWLLRTYTKYGKVGVGGFEPPTF